MINEPDPIRQDYAAEDVRARDEKDLVRQAQSGNADAFAEIYEEYFDKVYRYTFYRVANRTEAEDLTQQVFLKAIQSISSFKWRGVPFSAWIFRIARNQVIDYQRKASKMKTSTLDPEITASGSDPASIAERSMDIRWVNNAMTNLSQLQQEALSLRFAGELSTAETAKVMDKSEGAVKALQHSALATLRKILHEEESHSSEV
ncbi:sigma-70 family RNA polymerase sigma factor [Chloroflexota bacterium]